MSSGVPGKLFSFSFTCSNCFVVWLSWAVWTYVIATSNPIIYWWILKKEHSGFAISAQQKWWIRTTPTSHTSAQGKDFDRCLIYLRTPPEGETSMSMPMQRVFLVDGKYSREEKNCWVRRCYPPRYDVIRIWNKLSGKEQTRGVRKKVLISLTQEMKVPLGLILSKFAQKMAFSIQYFFFAKWNEAKEELRARFKGVLTFSEFVVIPPIGSDKITTTCPGPVIMTFNFLIVLHLSKLIPKKCRMDPRPLK